MEQSNNHDSTLLLELTAEVVSAYVAKNPIAAGDLSGLIRDVHQSLGGVSEAAVEPEVEKQKPEVSVRKSLGHDYLICLEDGKKFKSLKRHLKTHYNLSPEAYREKWGLPADYPMVAPAYAEQRSRLAKEMGLGQKRKAA
ncbi:MAG: MucR family transcriptional regulator [Pseudomonadota bacterium]